MCCFELIREIFSEIRPLGDTHYNQKRAMNRTTWLTVYRGVETGSKEKEKKDQ